MQAMLSKFNIDTLGVSEANLSSNLDPATYNIDGYNQSAAMWPFLTRGEARRGILILNTFEVRRGKAM